MAYGLRSCVDMIEAIHQIRQYSPEAWILNYSNPAAIVAEALRREFPDDKARKNGKNHHEQPAHPLKRGKGGTGVLDVGPVNEAGNGGNPGVKGDVRHHQIFCHLIRRHDQRREQGHKAINHKNVPPERYFWGYDSISRGKSQWRRRCPRTIPGGAL